MTDHPPAQSPARRKQGFLSLRTVIALMMREMATSYGRSPGGYLWAMLEPIGGIALLTFLFTFHFAAPAIGVNFPIFYATGLVPLLMYMDLSNKISMSVIFSKPLLAYPRVTFIDALMARFLINLITQLMVGYVLFTGILFFYETRTTPDPLGIAVAFGMAASLALGLGTLNSFLFSVFPLFQRVWTIMARPLVLISGVIFILESIPQPYRDWLWWNPLIHVVGQMRRSFYPTYEGDYVSYTYVMGISCVTFLLGLIFLRRYGRDMLEW